MPRQKRVKTPNIVVMYTIQHLTMEEIGKLIGMSRMGVMRRLRKSGITSGQGEWVNGVCDYCGQEYQLLRKRWRTSKKHYCKNECYYASQENPGYKPWRHGLRLARAIISQYHLLLPNQVVHHKDSNCRNNNIDNLAVYASNSDHIKATHHKNHKVKPVWDGSHT